MTYELAIIITRMRHEIVDLRRDITIIFHVNTGFDWFEPRGEKPPSKVLVDVITVIQRANDVEKWFSSVLSAA